MRKNLLSLLLLLSVAISSTAFASAGPSLIYDGIPLILSSLGSELVGAEENSDFTLTNEVYTAFDNKLQIFLQRKTYKNYPVEEYSLTLKNLSETESTGLIENFQAFDGYFNPPNPGDPVRLNLIVGIATDVRDFSADEIHLPVGEIWEHQSLSGCPSSDYLPFFEAQFDEDHGVILGLGWTGTWKYRAENSGSGVKMSIGMSSSYFRLNPGESIRQPSILLFTRSNQDRRQFKTLVHRFMLDFKVPRRPDGTLHPPIFAVTAAGGNKTPEMMLDILQYTLDHHLNFETFWVDAGWCGPPHETDPLPNCGTCWGDYLGDYRVNTTVHPTGTLLPISDAVHRAGMRFLLWFEPERIGGLTNFREEHPDYFYRQLVVGNYHENLVNYGNPEALAWMQEKVYKVIEENKIDIFREDFNTSPGPTWVMIDQENPERVGMAEARHVTGLYKFLDDMRVRFPNIAQENCAGGGRRIDYEMISRAVSYCRSDFPIGPKPNDEAFMMSQNANLNSICYLPFQGSETNCAPFFDDYGMASCLSSPGTVFTPTDFDHGIITRPFTEEETAWFVSAFAVGRKIYDLVAADFYPLVDECIPSDDLWCAWQFFDTESNSGFAAIFRRPNAPEAERVFNLTGIDPDAIYDLELYSGNFIAEKTICSGKDFLNWKSAIDPRSFQFVFYKKQ